MATKYFIADIDDLPDAVKQNGLLSHHDSKVKYSILGCDEPVYDEHIKDVTKKTDITEEEALVGGRCWADTRAKRSEWVAETDVDKSGSVKTKIDITDEMRETTLKVMKIIAKLNVQYAIDEGEGAPYDASLLTDIENSASVEQINIIYENYLGADIGAPQATTENKYESDGFTRKYDAARNQPSFL